MIRAMLDEHEHFLNKLVDMVDTMIRHNNKDDEIEQEVQNFFMGRLEFPMPWPAVKEFVQERRFNFLIDSWLERG